MKKKTFVVLPLAAALVLGLSMFGEASAQPGGPDGRHPGMERGFDGSRGRPDIGRPDGPRPGKDFRGEPGKRPDGPDFGRPDRRGQGKDFQGRPGERHDKSNIDRPDRGEHRKDFKGHRGKNGDRKNLGRLDKPGADRNLQGRPGDRPEFDGRGPRGGDDHFPNGHRGAERN